EVQRAVAVDVDQAAAGERRADGRAGGAAGRDAQGAAVHHAGRGAEGVVKVVAALVVQRSGVGEDGALVEVDVAGGPGGGAGVGEVASVEGLGRACERHAALGRGGAGALHGAAG